MSTLESDEIKTILMYFCQTTTLIILVFLTIQKSSCPMCSITSFSFKNKITDNMQALLILILCYNHNRF